MSGGIREKLRQTCEIINVELLLHQPAPPVAGVQVHLLHPLLGHLLPHLHHERTGELHLLPGDLVVLVEVGRVVGPFSVQVEVSLEAVVTRGPDTEPAGPSAVRYNEKQRTLSDCSTYWQSGAFSLD